MDTLKDIISDIRVFLYGSIVSLPLCIAGTMLILGLFTANYAILFFLVGYLILTPFVASIFNFILTAAFGNISIFKAKTTDICKLVIPYTTLKYPIGIIEESVILSPWSSMTAFFIGYILTNALELYNRESPDIESDIKDTQGGANDTNTKISTRKTQAIISIASIIIFALIAFGFRYNSGCESTVGMIITILLFMFIGYGWYKLLSKTGEDRLSDLFGIANRLLSPGAIQNAPIACVPIPV